MGQGESIVRAQASIEERMIGILFSCLGNGREKKCDL